MKNIIAAGILVCAMVPATTCLYAQEIPPLKISNKTPYYIDVNQADKSRTYDLHDGYLSLQYEDRFGSMKTFQLKMYNSKMQLAGNFTLDKTFGLNNYNIELNEVSPLDPEQSYLCQFTDESGTTHEWYIRDPIRKKVELDVDIFVNPLAVDCKATAGNAVEYYGQVSNGRGPYTLRWYILNDMRTDFLYQPREDKLTDPGKTSAVHVDKSPDYFVVLDATDACGATGRKMIFMNCEMEKKTISTIFAEPLFVLPEVPKTGN